jgi:hypothetical protein
MYYYNQGGTTTSVPSSGGTAGDPVGKSEALADYAGEYVTGMLGKGQAVADMPYQAYTGPLSAGASDVQQQAFTGLANLAMPTTPANFDAATAQSYMNPFIEGALNPQLQAAQRQADAQRLANAAKMGQVGAFGGSRLGLVEAEGQRNLNEQLANIRATGYSQAYDKARDQFAGDRRYGLEGLAAQRAGGAEQRAIEAEGIARDYEQFREERDFPYRNLAFQSSLLQGLPITAQSYSYTQPSTISQLLGDGGSLLELLGIIPKKEEGSGAGGDD